MFRTHLLTAALAAALLAPIAAQAGHVNCDVDSDYHLTVQADGLLFNRDAGSPAQVELRNGTLLVDGEILALSGADAERVRDFEAHVRELVPQVKRLALDAIDLATTAVSQVLTTLAAEGADATHLNGRIDELATMLRDKVETANSTRDFKDAEFEATIEKMAREIGPSVAVVVAPLAMSAALSGDEAGMKAFENRMENMGREIEKMAETRAKEIEARAEALCPAIKDLANIEDQLEYRFPDGSPLNLIEG